MLRAGGKNCSMTSGQYVGTQTSPIRSLSAAIQLPSPSPTTTTITTARSVAVRLPSLSFSSSSFLSLSKAVAVVAATAAPASSLYVSSRGVASYPSPGRVKQRGGPRKSYNYLTGQRLVRTPRRRESREVIRHSDDKGLAKRREYHRMLRKNVEEDIHYFPPFVTQAVFFPRVAHGNRTLMFLGSHVLSQRSFVRVYDHVLKQITSGAQRPALKALMGKVGVEVPEDDVWKRYCDPDTGDINIGLLYSVHVRRVLVTICQRAVEGGGNSPACNLTISHAYILRYFCDTSRVPSLQQWSAQFGPLRAREMVKNTRLHSSVMLALREAKKEINQYGMDTIRNAAASLTPEARQALLDDVMANYSAYYTAMREQLLFASQVLLAVNSLPEIRAIQRPVAVFTTEQECQHVIARQGNLYPPYSTRSHDWAALSTEEKNGYYCFKRGFERRCSTGQQLFARYCTRDYGISSKEARKRYAALSDLQKAAVDFPFYLPITPPRPATVAFKRFLLHMCARYGLTRSYNGLAGNRVFVGALRQKWRNMTQLERLEFEQGEELDAVFPLQPVKPKFALDAEAPPPDTGFTADGDDVEARARQAVSHSRLGRRQQQQAAKHPSAAQVKGPTTTLSSKGGRRRANTSDTGGGGTRSPADVGEGDDEDDTPLFVYTKQTNPRRVPGEDSVDGPAADVGEGQTDASMSPPPSSSASPKQSATQSSGGIGEASAGPRQSVKGRTTTPRSVGLARRRVTAKEANTANTLGEEVIMI